MFLAGGRVNFDFRALGRGGGSEWRSGGTGELGGTAPPPLMGIH